MEKVGASIRRLAQDMLETMYANNGLGLAATQIGKQEAMCVIDVSPAQTAAREQDGPVVEPGIPMPLIMINPVITEESGEQVGQEGCLSFPEIFVSLACAAAVTVQFADLEGRQQTLQATGLFARAVQHELDHLKGILLVDRMSAVQKVGMAGKLRRLKKMTLELATVS